MRVPWFLKQFARSVLLWAVLVLLWQVAWGLGGRTLVGRSLASPMLLLLSIPAAWAGRLRWRSAVCSSLALTLPACALLFWRDFVNQAVHVQAEAPIEKLAALLDITAWFLREVATATALSVFALLFCFRPSGPLVERRAFVMTTTVALLVTLNTTLLCGVIQWSLAETTAR